MNAENEKLLRAQAEAQHEPTLRDIQEQLSRLENRLGRDAGADFPGTFPRSR
jgi:hypothetical protein